MSQLVDPLTATNPQIRRIQYPDLTFPELSDNFKRRPAKLNSPQVRANKLLLQDVTSGQSHFLGYYLPVEVSAAKSNICGLASAVIKGYVMVITGPDSPV